VAHRPTQTESYWADGFEVQQDDIDHLYNVLLERETPLSADEMALVLVRYRMANDEAQEQEKARPKNIYKPDQVYEVGDKLVFPQFHDKKGTVTATRTGENPDDGEFGVITVEMADGEVKELAANLQSEHVLSVEEEVEPEPEEDLLSPEEIFIEHGGYVAESLEERLEEHGDLVRLAGSWFPKSLLTDVNIGHLNLAEAVLDMYDGGPLSTPEIIEQIGMLENINDRLAEFSVNYGLQQDERFDEVGPAGQVLWYLVRMEPDEVKEIPERLIYEPVPFDPSDLNEEMTALVRQIGDEHSNLPYKPGPRPDSVTLTLTYPHRRAGTLPLSNQLRRMFPTAYQAPRVRFTFVDAENGDEIPGWVVRQGGYVYGLKTWIENHEILTGSYITVERTDDPGKVKIGFDSRNPRKEWVRTARVDGNRLRFEETQREIGSGYDELMAVDVPDPIGVDELWQGVKKRGVLLEQIMLDIGRELASLMPQGNIHAKTMYSAVNLLRRCPPGPIFARLDQMIGFEHVGGPYWRMSDTSSDTETA